MKNRRKLARVGDRIEYTSRYKILTGTVVKRTGEYLEVSLDSPREVLDYEKAFHAIADPMKDTVYLHGIYHIKEYGDG